MTDPAENNALPPFKLAVAASTAVLCTVIIYNAVAGQDGRERNEQQGHGRDSQHRSLHHPELPEWQMPHPDPRRQRGFRRLPEPTRPRP